MRQNSALDWRPSSFLEAKRPRFLLAPFGGRLLAALGPASRLELPAGSQDAHDCLSRVEARCREKGQWAIGYISYEGFNPELGADADWPALRFDFFSDPHVDLIQNDIPLNAWQGFAFPDSTVPPFEAQWPAGQFARKVEQIRQLIRKGDCYQINLVQPFQTVFPTAFASGLFAALRLHDPAPRGFRALLEYEDRALVSDSPELFVQRSGNRLLTAPIKGTLARNDKNGPEELLASGKDRAELAMIGDLLRNDLSRCCKPGSVRTGPFPELVELPTLYHTQLRVEGEILPESGLADCMAALFPCGSISGCPKQQAMGRIQELEGRPRGPMMGAVGWISPAGDFAFGVTIRTALLKDDRLELLAGGGITWDSQPEDEEKESLSKIRAFQRALEILNNFKA